MKIEIWVEIHLLQEIWGSYVCTTYLKKFEDTYLVGGWATPLKNMSSSVGSIILKYSQYMEK